MSQRLRATAATLEQDLKNITVIMDPPRQPQSNEGYFQYVEGPIGPIVDPADVAVNTEHLLQVDLNGNHLDADTTVGDIDDIIAFTANTKGQPYVGLVAGQAAVSNTAEIIWFIRGTTLYRRVLLVNPQLDVRGVSPYGFYSAYDLSVRKVWDNSTVTTSSGAVQHRPVLRANSLADLTRPECRFAHHPDLRAWTATTSTTPPTSVSSAYMPAADSTRYVSEGKVFPHFLRPWLGAPVFVDTDGDGSPDTPRWVPGLGLPILAESSTPYLEVAPEPDGGPMATLGPHCTVCPLGRRRCNTQCSQPLVRPEHLDRTETCLPRSSSHFRPALGQSNRTIRRMDKPPPVGKRRSCHRRNGSLPRQRNPNRRRRHYDQRHRLRRQSLGSQCPRFHLLDRRLDQSHRCHHARRSGLH